MLPTRKHHFYYTFICLHLITCYEHRFSRQKADEPAPQSYVLRPNNSIDKEHVEIEKLLAGAKNGDWDDVWEVLGPPASPRKGYLLNVIPQNRRWGVIHQAVYWKKEQDLRKLLSYKACDVSTPTKLCTSDSGKTGFFTALDIAEQQGYSSMISILESHLGHESVEDVPTFNLYSDFNEQYGLGLISVTLAAYKGVFCSDTIDPSKGITALLHEIWNDIKYENSSKWSQIRNVVADSVFPICQENSDTIKNSTNKDEFFEAIINTYTREENRMYTHLNLAFRRQRQDNYKPTGVDLALGPYAVVYQMLLLFWPKVKPETVVTYRRMLLTRADCDKYQTGTKFVWPSVVSSSKEIESAKAFPTCGSPGNIPVIFHIDNRRRSNWQPKNIDQFSYYMEHERTYPAGAKFEVTRSENTSEGLTIWLKLIS